MKLKRCTGKLDLKLIQQLWGVEEIDIIPLFVSRSSWCTDWFGGLNAWFRVVYVGNKNNAYTSECKRCRQWLMMSEMAGFEFCNHRCDIVSFHISIVYLIVKMILES